LKLYRDISKVLLIIMCFCAGPMAGLGLLLTADSQRYSYYLFYAVVSSQQ